PKTASTNQEPAMTRAPSIRLAARPFIARALHGPRGRRLMAVSVLLTALSGALGTWLALGTGGFERGLRVALDLEQRREVQERARFVLIAETEEEAAALRAALGSKESDDEALFFARYRV